MKDRALVDELANAARQGAKPGKLSAGVGLADQRVPVVRISPSRSPDLSALPRGRPTKIERKDNESTRRGKDRENEAAQLLARLGFDIEQQPKADGNRNPDYRIEGEIFDAYSPDTARLQFSHWPIPGLLEIIAVKSGKVVRIFPDVHDF